MIKKHGNQKIIVLHGGPGAIGAAHSLAKYLRGIEVLNYGQTIEKQIEEIDEAIENIDQTVIVGHSWGAWLAYIYASLRPVKKVILLGSGAFDDKYLNTMMIDRMAKLTDQEEEKAKIYFENLSEGVCPKMLDDFNYIMSKMDSYNLIRSEKLDSFDLQGHHKLMKEINALRRSFELLNYGHKIKGQVVVMHGLSDSHPLQGITEPFDRINLDYKLYTYEKCGHSPWLEVYAKDQFLMDIYDETNYIFKTERLGFRHFTLEDSETFYEMNSNDWVMQYFPTKLDKEASDQFLRRIIDRYQEGFGLYAVECLQSHDFIGFIGLARPTFQADFTPCIEIGWRLKKEYWHQGYATEGASSLIKYARDVLEINEIVSFTASINKASIAVMKRIGMTFDKTFDHPRVEGDLKAHVLYKLSVNEM